MEYTAARLDGITFPVEIYTSSMRSDDETLQGLVHISTDISEQRQADEVLRKPSWRLKNEKGVLQSFDVSAPLENCHRSLTQVECQRYHESIKANPL